MSDIKTRGVRATKKQQTRRAILDAAIKLFVQQGYENTSVDELAREAGVGKGTIYGYFHGKSEILLAFCDDELDAVFADLAAKSQEDGPLLDQLLTLFMSQFRYVTRHHDFGRILAREMIFPKELTQDKVNGLEQRYLTVLYQILDRAIARGELRAGQELLFLAGHFYALYIMMLSSWYKGRFTTELQIEEALKILFLQALAGLSIPQ